MTRLEGGRAECAPGGADRDGRRFFDDVSHRRYVPDRSAGG